MHLLRRNIDILDYEVFVLLIKISGRYLQLCNRLQKCSGTRIVGLFYTQNKTILLIESKTKTAAYLVKNSGIDGKLTQRHIIVLELNSNNYTLY